MPHSAIQRLVQVGRTRLALVGVLVALILLGISWLASDLVRQVEERSEARSDNAQWLLSQFELELLYLLNVADSASHGAAGLPEVRLRYDIFYGRLKMLREGRASDLLRQDPDFDRRFARIEDFVGKYLPYVDGSDADLTAVLPQMVVEADALTVTARELALAGVGISAGVSDARRIAVARTLTLTGVLTAALIVFLLALLAILLRLYRFNRQRSAENIATLSRLNAVVSTTMEALITVDGKGGILDLNEAARQAFGLAGREVRGLDMAGLFAGEDAIFRPGSAPNVDSQGRFRLTARHSEGRLFPVELSISRVRGMEEVLFVVFLRDLSAQLQAEQALVLARDKALAGEKAKADLLAVMSHEIRTPLNGMIGTIELLDGSELNCEQREFLRILQASGQLLMHHVNDVLAIARLDSGLAAPLLAPVDLAEVVREVVENQRPAARANGNELSFCLPEGERFVVQSDGSQLRQVLLNLVGNAVKFTRNGKITVELDEDPGRGGTQISVRDTGIGIARANVERIFDDFVTLDASYARPSSGTGLGLGIVRRIVAQMGGSLTVDSREGEGSLFRVHLPYGRQALAPLPAGAAVARAGTQTRRIRALVVEDNDFNRLIVTEFLRRDGHEVVEASDGEAGIARAGEGRFDVILMDISMPGMDGLQATAAIRSGGGVNRDCPVIAMTAHALDEDLARFRDGGMGWVLVKPVTRDRLRGVLDRAVPPRAKDAAAPEVLRREVLEALRQDLGPERAATLIARFRDEAGQIGARVQAALAGGADAEDRRQAHRLAGSAAMFGAAALAGLLAEIETGWKTGAALDGAALADRLGGILRATQDALQEGGFAQASSLR